MKPKSPNLYDSDLKDESFDEESNLRAVLMRSLGPNIDDSNYRQGNIKRMYNLAMYGGFALCEEKQHERTFLDKIKIEESNLMQLNKPVHIDKLFANEE